MPVKVRCECGAGISAPDAARGKTIKCKQCGSPVRVPGGRRKKAAKKKRAEPTPLDAHDDDFFSQIDMGRMEDQEVQLCPKCATEVDEDDIECPNCGVNLETGELSTKQKNLRKYKGPNPDEFYKVSWGNSFQFLKANMGIAFSLCLFFAISSSLYCGTLFMATYCEKKPLIIFWSSLAFICGVAPMGAVWQLWIETVKATRDGQDVLKRFKFDFFSCVTLGIKAYVWPIALNLPLLMPIMWLIGLAVAMGSGTALLSSTLLLMIALPVMYLLPMVCYPVAMSHMASKYPFRAYLPVQMFRVTFQNFGAVAWWFLMWLGLWAITLTVVIVGIIYAARLFAFFSDSILKLIELCGLSIAEADRGFMFAMAAAGIGMVVLFIIQFVTALISCIPMVMMMRANGLLAHYNARTLELGFKVNGGTPAGFWVRYLAFLVDLCVVAVFYVGLLCAFYVLNWMTHALEMSPETIERTKDCIYWGCYVGAVFVPFLYFLMEGGPSSCTMGMRALGLEVVQKGRPRIQSNAVVMRALLRTVTIILSAVFPPAAAMFMQCGWTADKQAMHDKLTGTEVVWRHEHV